MKISEHHKDGRVVGYKKYIHGRNFHLVTGTAARDREFAVAYAVSLTATAEALQRLGGSWTEALIQQAKVVALERVPFGPAPVGPIPPPVPQPEVRLQGQAMALGAAVEQFRSAEWVRVQSHKIGVAHYHSRCDYMDAVVAAFGERIPLPPTLGDIKQWVGWFLSRPISKKTDKPISPSYAVGICKALHFFLDWADAEGHWIAPRRWNDAFKGISEKKLMTLAEKSKNSKGFKVLALDDAQWIWHISTMECRVLLGLGLFAALTQTEISTCLLDEFIEAPEGLYLDRNRHKTGVWGKWWLPPELAVEIRRWLKRTRKFPAERNPDGRAFLGVNDLPLVHFGKNGDKQKTDNVKDLWERARRYMKSHHGRAVPSFKSLRKTISKDVRHYLGVEFAVAFCAQSAHDVQTISYTKADMEKLMNCVKHQIYPAWQQMFARPSSKKAAA